MSITRYLQCLAKGQLLKESELVNLCETALCVLLQEPNVIEVSGSNYVVGDIHGQFYDMLKMLHEVAPAAQTTGWVFLGDYVDRGYHSIETISYLLCMKCLHPTRVILLRGNHETSSLTRIYGFYDEVDRKYGNHLVWKCILNVFNHLPLAAIICRTIVCLHGGLSPMTPFIDDIALLNRLQDIPETGAMSDLVWSDPSPSDCEGWATNSRGAGFTFSHSVAKEFLHLNDASLIARAHQLVEEGHIYNFPDKSLVTVWSAPNYCYRCGNNASIMLVREDCSTSFFDYGPSQMTASRKIHYEHTLPYFL